MSLLFALLPALAMVGQAATVREPQWELVFSDEFDGSTIDRAKWDFDVDCWGGGNDERQCYTADRGNAFVAEGALHIVARRERSSGFALPLGQRATADDPDLKATRPFTSARLVTRGKAAWRYGKIEVRAKLPQGQGTWPAIWMLPEDQAYGPWAASGEIDIMEAVNLGTACPACPSGREDRVLGTLHFGGPFPANRHKGVEHHYPPVLEGFHTFGIEWSEGRIVWTLDGTPYAVQTAEDWHSAATSDPDAPFDRRFHLILNLAIGGRLAEGRGLTGVSRAGFPKTMTVDWVRVWQCRDDRSTGKSCAR